MCPFIHLWHTNRPTASQREISELQRLWNQGQSWICVNMVLLFLTLSYHTTLTHISYGPWNHDRISMEEYYNNINSVRVVWFGLFGDTYERLTWPWSVHPRTPKPRTNNPLKQKRSCNNPRRLTAHLSSSATIKILLIMFSLYHIQTLQEYKVNIILL